MTRSGRALLPSAGRPGSFSAPRSARSRGRGGGALPAAPGGTSALRRGAPRGPRSSSPSPGAARGRSCRSRTAPRLLPSPLLQRDEPRGNRDAARWDLPRDRHRTTERPESDGGPLKAIFPSARGSRAALGSTTRSDPRRSPPRAAVSQSSACRPRRFGPVQQRDPRPDRGAGAAARLQPSPRTGRGRTREAIPAPGAAPSRAPHGVTPPPADPRGRPFPWRRAAARVGTTASEAGGAEPV